MKTEMFGLLLKKYSKTRNKTVVNAALLILHMEVLDEHYRRPTRDRSSQYGELIIMFHRYSSSKGGQVEGMISPKFH